MLRPEATRLALREDDLLELAEAKKKAAEEQAQLSPAPAPAPPAPAPPAAKEHARAPG